MLCNIDPNVIEDAKRIFTLLCYAQSPLRLEELIEGVAVDIDSASFNVKRRLQTADDIHQICSGLVEIDDLVKDVDPKLNIKIVRIAHLSVQEYLRSEQIQVDKAAKFSLVHGTAHAEIALICLIYLLEPGLSSIESNASFRRKFPLAYFAARCWRYHYNHAEDQIMKLESTIRDLFQSQSSWLTWIQLCDPDQSIADALEEDQSSYTVASPIYYAAYLGLDRILDQLLGDIVKNPTKYIKSRVVVSKIVYFPETLADTHEYLQELLGEVQARKFQLISNVDFNINAQGGTWATPLHAGSALGNERVVQLLLKHGANINAQDVRAGTPLQVASYRGHDRIMQLLLINNADVNAQGGCGNALIAASLKNHAGAVRMLLEKGADVNASGNSGTALQIAARRGYEAVIQLLIENGADVNALGARGNLTAFQMAARRSDEKIAALLIKEGADVNAHGRAPTALQWASEFGRERIVNFLIENV